jgi:hypothetical protein
MLRQTARCRPRRKDQIQVERPVLQLHEVLAALDLLGLFLGQCEAELFQRGDEAAAVVRGLLDKQVGILRGVGEAEQDGAGLPEE